MSDENTRGLERSASEAPDDEAARLRALWDTLRRGGGSVVHSVSATLAYGRAASFARVIVPESIGGTVLLLVEAQSLKGEPMRAWTSRTSFTALSQEGVIIVNATSTEHLSSVAFSGLRELVLVTVAVQSPYVVLRAEVREASGMWNYMLKASIVLTEPGIVEPCSDNRERR